MLMVIKPIFCSPSTPSSNSSNPAPPSAIAAADRLNSIGEAEGAAAGVAFLPSDFKKKNGYLRSTELSREYGLYRQDYCGCSFSKAEAHRRNAARAAEGLHK